MLKNGFFPFHIVDESPWPLYMSLGGYMLFTYTILTINHLSYSFYILVLILFFVFSSFYGWMRDVCSEGFLQGNHTTLVQTGLKTGMVLFIISEVLFFFSFFWSLFYYSVTPSVEIYSWPPTGLESVDPMGVPLLGTLILISSGISITWSHHATMHGDKNGALTSLALTIMMGLIFSVLQFTEYKECSFTISDSVFGSIFFLSTGFHGFHVLVGTFMLIFCFIRMYFNHFSLSHHVGYEAAIWYWHFVDVVWIFLYICMYWWGSPLN
uniref:Cytochrome c oxidase subunit 3 n=1 Tax=Colpocephalum griffoneae TaxID=2358484 RepID=A0A386B2F1_9NEOP|nr:cytochrome c oxidase subunit III [Colpocephalum griffoneae]AYC65898.1 cytochrome c oxidase subunit III [Colpocephalum griffoneae]